MSAVSTGRDWQAGWRIEAFPASTVLEARLRRDLTGWHRPAMVSVVEITRWLGQGLERRGIPNVDAWVVHGWVDYLDHVVVIKLTNPEGQAFIGRASLKARLAGWNGWYLYRAAASALRALG